MNEQGLYFYNLRHKSRNLYNRYLQIEHKLPKRLRKKCSKVFANVHVACLRADVRRANFWENELREVELEIWRKEKS